MKNLIYGAMVWSIGLVALAQAGDGCCSQCGCRHQVQKVCRMVPDVKVTVRWEYDVECEDFCIPGPSKYCGTRQVTDCHGTRCEKIMMPTCAKVQTRKVLVKKPIVTETPTWKWVVEYLCCDCRAASAKAPAANSPAASAASLASSESE